MARTASNVERIRQPFTWRQGLRIALVVVGIAGGVAIALALTPRGDTLAFDVGLARGAALGLLLGIVAAALVPSGRGPVTAPRVRPSGFDALRAELAADPMPADHANDVAADRAADGDVAVREPEVAGER
ncbi:hypothetical protein [Egicoccus halophilus]|uniref:Uncharacterized protein n=1 Tax=Egicoccus halophilus TaxID=1670830 RepID=A0A8J3AAP8_9ACTN|nr:hypothetical protein [Egicoccus halophilus]GGI08997.1 hypothetical protein GCM10011354_31880 [Egicoccus halophilus]